MNIVLMKNPRQAILIPEEALVKRGDDNFVYVPQEQDGKLIAHLLPITIGQRRPGQVEVTSGLTADDQVIHHGAVKIKPGTDITIRVIQTTDTPLTTLLESPTDKD